MCCYRSASPSVEKGLKWSPHHVALTMAQEIFSIAAVFWVLIPVGLIGGAVLLKLQGD